MVLICLPIAYTISLLYKAKKCTSISATVPYLVALFVIFTGKEHVWMKDTEEESIYCICGGCSSWRPVSHIARGMDYT